ncbi:MAG: Hsp20 family protein [Acidobacteriota bacterium]
MLPRGWTEERRSFKLPNWMRTDKAEAVFDKGILKVVFPKSEEAKEQAIKVEVK